MTLLSIDPRLEQARTRRMLEDTAVNAAGGGVLTALEADSALGDVFHAHVTRGDGTRLRLRLDRGLQTVAIQPEQAARRVA
jgi:hypothetical protein